MGEIADLSDLVNRMTGGAFGAPEHINWYRDLRVMGVTGPTTVAGRYTSLWRFEGIPAAGETPPATPVTPTSETSGSLRQQPATGGQTKYLIAADATAQVAGTLVLYDRLLHGSGLVGNITSVQSYAGGPIIRNVNGVGNEVWIEIYTDIGTTATTITVTYTNDSGNSRTTTTPIGGTGLRERERIIRVPLAANCRGVQSVQSVQLTGTTGTAGDFGVVIARPLLSIPVSTGSVLGVKDLISGFPAMLPIDQGSCLAWAFLANAATTTPIAMGSLHFVEA
jgi:hypothetical protein